MPLDCEILETDLLIVGGGAAGLVAAVAARQRGADVIVVDKATAGRSGQAGMTAGRAWVLAPDDDFDAWARWQVEAGEYLNDQDFLYQLGRRSHPVFSQLVAWGLPFAQDRRGQLVTTEYSAMPAVWSSTTFDPERLTVVLADLARERGVRLIGRTQVVEPLLADGRVVGAAGFDVLTGKPRVFRARATLLASGSCDYRGERLFRTSSGEAVAFAFRAGARLRNAEFGNLYLPRFQGLDVVFRGVLLKFVTNALDERLWDRYLDPGRGEDMGRIILGMVREHDAERGPCQLDFTKVSEEDPDQPRGKHPSNPERLLAKLLEVNPDAASPLQQVVPAFVGKLSPVMVDLGYRTTVPGLWAAGDVSHMGSSFEGAQPGGQIAGTGVSYALISGFDAGSALGAVARDLPPPPPAIDGQHELPRVLGPLGRPGTPPDELIRAVQRVMFPVRSSLLRTATRLEEGLAEVARLRQRAGHLAARDAHELVKLHEARSMLLCAEMTFRAALLRTETRGSHLREDYQATRDDEWLAWVVIERDGDLRDAYERGGYERDHAEGDGAEGDGAERGAERMRLSLDRVPIERYPLQPAPRPSPWDRPRRTERPSVAPPSRRARARSRPAPTLLPELNVTDLQLRGLDDQRVDPARWRGTVLVLSGGGYAAIPQSACWSQALERLLAGRQGVSYCRLAVVKLPRFVPRAVVKNQLRKSPGQAPFLVAWDDRERANLPLVRDDTPYVLIFDADGWLTLVLEENHSDTALERVKEQVAALARAG